MKKTTTYLIILGAYIKYHRKKLNLDQQAFADAIDASQTMVSRMERGNMVINVLQLKTIWECFEISPKDFFEDIELIIETLDDANISVTDIPRENGKQITLTTDGITGIIHWIGHF